MYNPTLKAEVRMLAVGVPKGTTANGLLCPFCQGGRSAERTLSITHRGDGICLYICHRATCGQAGRVFANGNVIGNASEQPVRTFKPRQWNGLSRSPNDEERYLLENQYGFSYREIMLNRISIVSENQEFAGRAVINIEGPRGQQRGHILRVLPGKEGKPKTLTYKVMNEPFAGWYQTQTSAHNKIVLVEDVFSAMKVARQFVCVALLGTHVTIENLFELLRYSDNIIVALDKDATKLALDYKQKFRFLAPQMQVAILEKDLKYCADAEIRERCNI